MPSEKLNETPARVRMAEMQLENPGIRERVTNYRLRLPAYVLLLSDLCVSRKFRPKMTSICRQFFSLLLKKKKNYTRTIGHAKNPTIQLKNALYIHKISCFRDNSTGYHIKKGAK